MENTTQKENELIGNTDKLKPEQMESGKWYVIETVYLWLIEFKNITNQNVNIYKSICIDSLVKYKYEDFNQCKIQHIKSIRHATKEEVLKYFLDEKFENVSLINEGNNTQVTEQQNQIEPEKVEVDWKAKFEELQNRYEVLVTESHKLDILSGEMCDKYTDLKKDYENLHFTYKELMKIHEEQDLAYDALADKYSRLEDYDKELEKVSSQQSKIITNLRNELQEKESKKKVYFCNTHKGYQFGGLEWAIKKSIEQEPIYEAVKIGVKKSILVNENS